MRKRNRKNVAIVCLLFTLMFIESLSLVAPVQENASVYDLLSGVRVQAASKNYKIQKKGNKYYCYDNAGNKVGGYYLQKSNNLKKCRLYKFNKKKYMSAADYSKMVKAIEKQSYSELCKAIGKGKQIGKSKGCNGGKYDYIFQYGGYLVYTTDDKITYISEKESGLDW